MARWNRKTFTSTGITQAPPGPYLDLLARRGIGTIQVTSRGFDDIGAVLTSMRVAHEPFDGRFECDLLFVNCGTADTIDQARLADFVVAGGCLYASDLTSSLIRSAFPGLFTFTSSGRAGRVEAVVIDPELSAVVGERTTIEFDMNGWSILGRCAGDTLVQAASSSAYAPAPIMVGVEHGQGAIFYTSFHNRAQSSAQDRVLLQLLGLKQIGARTNISLEQASRAAGVNLSALRAQLGR